MNIGLQIEFRVQNQQTCETRQNAMQSTSDLTHLRDIT